MFIIGPSLFMTNLVYFEIKPRLYLCTYTDGHISHCNLEEICDSNQTQLAHWEVDTSVNHFNNIITDFGINCEGKVGIGLIGSMYYIGEATASVCYLMSVKCMQ